MAFKVGDRVVIVKSDEPSRIGVVARIIGVERTARPTRRTTLGVFPRPFPTVHDLDIPGAAQPEWPASYPPQWLELYRPDHNEKAEWSEELKRLCKVGEDA